MSASLGSVHPDTAKALVDTAATIVCLDVPPGLELGLDCYSWVTGPKFRGVKMIPPGLHILYYGGGLASRRFAMLHCAVQQVVVLQWCAETEDLVDLRRPVPSCSGGCGNGGNGGSSEGGMELTAALLHDVKQPDHDQADRVEAAVRRRELDTFLGPYPWDHYKQWRQLTSHLAPAAAGDGGGEEEGSKAVFGMSENDLARMHKALGACNLRLDVHVVAQGDGEVKDETGMDDTDREIERARTKLVAQQQLDAAAGEGGAEDGAQTDALRYTVRSPTVVPFAAAAVVPPARGSVSPSTVIYRGRGVSPPASPLASETPVPPRPSTSTSGDFERFAGEGAVVYSLMDVDGDGPGDESPPAQPTSNTHSAQASSAAAAAAAAAADSNSGASRQGGGGGVQFCHRMTVGDYRASLTPAQITAWSLDHSELLSHIVKAEFDSDITLLLAEFQLAFVTFLLGGLHDGFVQWKAIFELVCGCGSAIASQPAVFAQFLSTVESQLRLAPADMFEGMNDDADVTAQAEMEMKRSGTTTFVQAGIEKVCFVASQAVSAKVNSPGQLDDLSDTVLKEAPKQVDVTLMSPVGPSDAMFHDEPEDARLSRDLAVLQKACNHIRAFLESKYGWSTEDAADAFGDSEDEDGEFAPTIVD